MAVLLLLWQAITSRIAGPLGIGAAVFLLGWGVTERVQLAGSRLHAKQSDAKAAAAAADLSTCHANLRTVQDAQAVQEAAVQALKVQADAKDVALKKATHDALSARAVAESRVKEIEALKPSGDQTCPAVDAVLVGR